ncbi:hypothetical protein V8F20_001483 [Naviculisporaceae sp. PSN 640]
MHSSNLLALSLLGLSSASASCVPVPSASRGFRLVVNVTDPTKDITPPLHGQYLTLAHIGPAQNRAIVTASPGPIFYQNGTYDDITMQRTNVLTDAGTPLFPEGLAYQAEQDDSKGQGIYAFGGSGSGGIRLSRLWDPYSYLTILEGAPIQSTLAVCVDQTIPYYGDSRKFNVLNWVQSFRDGTGTHLVVPEGCVGVRLIPECAFLQDLPEGSISSHEFAQEVRCYEDVKNVVW